MPNSSWVERLVDLKADQVQRVSLDAGFNTAIVKNSSGATVYVHLHDGVSSSVNEAVAKGYSYATIVRTFDMKELYLLADQDCQVECRLLWVENPIILLPQTLEAGAGLDLGEVYKPKSAIGTANGPLIVSLDTGEVGGRTFVEVFTKAAGVGVVFVVEVSRDGFAWRKAAEVTISAGEKLSGYQNAYRYIRCSTTGAGANEIEIAASR